MGEVKSEWIWLVAAFTFLGLCLLLRHSAWMWLPLVAAIVCAVIGQRRFQ